MFKNRLYKNLQVYENFCEFYNILKHILKEIQYSCSGKRYGTWTSCCNSFNLQFPVKEVLYDSSDYINDLYTQYVSTIKYSTYFILYNYRTIITFIVFLNKVQISIQRLCDSILIMTKSFLQKKLLQPSQIGGLKKAVTFKPRMTKGLHFFVAHLHFHQI